MKIETECNNEVHYRDDMGLRVIIIKESDGTATILWADHSMTTMDSFDKAYEYANKCVGPLIEEE